MSGTPLALIGLGKMGRALEQLAPDHGFAVVARLDKRHPVTRESLGGAAMAIEFTEPHAAPGNIRACLMAGCPVVVGTTGWYEELAELRRETDDKVGAVLYAPNFSLGVAVFQQLVADAAQRFASLPGFDAHLIEIHHAAKKDAPSGTAAALAAAAAAARGAPVPITSVRTGSVPGTHELLFDAPFEQVRLVHEARDRRVFASGALAAARWLIGRRGVFTMQDVISTPDSRVSATS